MNEAPLYTFQAGGTGLPRGVLVVVTVVSLLGCAVTAALVPESRAGMLFAAVMLLVLCGLIWAVVPTRYELSRTHLSIVFPWKTWRVALDSVERARPGRWWESYAYWGLRFVTSPEQSIVIQRKRQNLLIRPNVVISPKDRDAFLRALNSLDTGVKVGGIA